MPGVVVCAWTGAVVQPARSSGGHHWGSPRCVLVGESADQLGQSWRKQCWLSSEPQVGAGVADDQVVMGEFDDARHGLSVKQHQRPGHPDSQIHRVVMQASAQQCPAFVVGDDMCGQTVAIQPGNREVGAQFVRVCPSQEIAESVMGGAALGKPELYGGLGHFSQGGVVVTLKPRQEISGDPDAGLRVPTDTAGDPAASGGA